MRRSSPLKAANIPLARPVIESSGIEIEICIKRPCRRAGERDESAIESIIARGNKNSRLDFKTAEQILAFRNKSRGQLVTALIGYLNTRRRPIFCFNRAA